MNLKKIQSYIVNPLDLCILIVVCAFILFGLFNHYKNNLFLLFNQTESAVISFNIDLNEHIDENTLKIGDEVFLGDTSFEIGKISKIINVREKKYSAINNTLLYDYSDKIRSVIIEVKTDIKTNEGNKFLNNSVFISPGSEIEIYFENLGVVNTRIEEILIV